MRERALLGSNLTAREKHLDKERKEKRGHGRQTTWSTTSMFVASWSHPRLISNY